MIPWAGTFVIDGQRRITVHCLDIDNYKKSSPDVHLDREACMLEGICVL